MKKIPETIRIVSTGRNEKGRTPFVEYYRRNDSTITIFHGEFWDSEEDVRIFEEMNKQAEESRRDFLQKQFRSEQSAKNCIITT